MCHLVAVEEWQSLFLSSGCGDSHTQGVLPKKYPSRPFHADSLAGKNKKNSIEERGSVMDLKIGTSDLRSENEKKRGGEVFFLSHICSSLAKYTGLLAIGLGHLQ
jgi:hypothetical protein